MVFVSAIGGLGGPTRSLLTLLRALDGRCSRVVACPPGAFADLAHEEKVLEHHIELPLRPVGMRRRLRDYMVAGARLAAWCSRNRWRVTAIHANGAAELHLSAPTAALTRRPVIVWAHAWQHSRWSPRLGPVWRLLVPNVRWAAVSTVARDVLVRERMTTADRVVLIPNPIDPVDVQTQDRMADGGPPTVGYLGSKSPSKGFLLLPDIVAACEGIDLRWLLALSPPDETWSEEQRRHWTRLQELGSRIEFAGRVSDVGTIYSRCDVVLSPSLDESFGRIAAEAMVSGIPVIASDIPALRELVGDEKAGLLFPVGDPEAAAQAIRKLALNPELRARLGAEGRARTARFHPAAVADQLAELYELFELPPPLGSAN